MSAAPAPDMIPRRPATVRMRNFQGALLVGDAEHMLKLSDSAAFVFRSIDGVRSIGDIARLVQDVYDIPPHSALQDVTELVGELAECQIVEMDARR